MQNQTRRGTGDKFLADEARRNQAKQSEMEQDLTKREVCAFLFIYRSICVSCHAVIVVFR